MLALFYEPRMMALQCSPQRLTPLLTTGNTLGNSGGGSAPMTHGG